MNQNPQPKDEENGEARETLPLKRFVAKVPIDQLEMYSPGFLMACEVLSNIDLNAALPINFEFHVLRPEAKDGAVLTLQEEEMLKWGHLSITVQECTEEQYRKKLEIVAKNKEPQIIV